MNLELTDREVWAFVVAGCNAAEIAAYVGVPVRTGEAMVSRARFLFAQGVGQQ